MGWGSAVSRAQKAVSSGGASELGGGGIRGIGNLGGQLGQGLTAEQQAQIDAAVAQQQQAGKEAEGIVGKAGTYARRDIRTGMNEAIQAQKPWMATGVKSMRDLYQMAQGNWDFQADPGYEFRIGQGEDAINRAAGVGGSRYSSATMKDLMGFNQGMASDEYGRAYARREGTLGGLAQMGQHATDQYGQIRTGGAAQMAGYGYQTGQDTADLRVGAADAAAAGAMAKAGIATEAQNALFGGMGDAASAYYGGG